MPPQVSVTAIGEDGSDHAVTVVHDSRPLPDECFAWLTPIMLWGLAQPMVERKVTRAQGGGTQRGDMIRSFAAVLFVLVTGSPWREVPRSFSVSWQTAHRRFMEWSRQELWNSLRQAARGPSGSAGLAHWADVVAAAAENRLQAPQARARTLYQKPFAIRISATTPFPPPDAEGEPQGN